MAIASGASIWGVVGPDHDVRSAVGHAADPSPPFVFQKQDGDGLSNAAQDGLSKRFCA
jgi:hypothetical protein